VYGLAVTWLAVTRTELARHDLGETTCIRYGNEPVDRMGTRDCSTAVRATLTPRRVALAGDDDIVLGPTGKIRKFVMRERHLARAAAP
jgi:hypothetical protein